MHNLIPDLNSSSPCAAAPAPAPAKRDVNARDTPRMKTTVTTMFVRGGPSIKEVGKYANQPNFTFLS